MPANAASMDFPEPIDAFSDAVVPEEPHDIFANEYGFYSVPRVFKHRTIPKILRSGDVYEPNTLRLMRRLAGNGDIISGGAFVGDFLPALAQALRPGALLHSFEPNPTAFDSARHTVALNDLQAVRLFHVGVGEDHAILPLQINGTANKVLAGGARIVPEQMDGATIDVPIYPLDDLVAPDRRVSILHLDIEGQECAALLGARRIIQSSRPIIIVETGKAASRRSYKRFMRDTFPNLGYKPAGAFERNLIFRAGPAQHET